LRYVVVVWFRLLFVGCCCTFALDCPFTLRLVTLLLLIALLLRCVAHVTVTVGWLLLVTVALRLIRLLRWVDLLLLIRLRCYVGWLLVGWRFALRFVTLRLVVTFVGCALRLRCVTLVGIYVTRLI